MADTTTTARLGAATLGSMVLGTTDLPNYAGDSFQWEGHCWELVTDPDLSTALVKPDGDTAAQDAFAARLANILRLNVENLYVTDEAVINEAVISKLFVDIFAAHKIGADQIAANAITADKIVASSELSAKVGNFLEISASQITSGSLTGETINGGTIIGGLFRTTASSKGEVMFSDTAADGGPGLRITPARTAGYSKMPNIGPSVEGVTIYGGKTTSGTESWAIFNSTGILLGRDSGSSNSVVKTYENYASVSATGTINGVQEAAQAVINAYANHPSVGTKLTLYASTDAEGRGTVQVSPTRMYIESTAGSGTRRLEGTTDRVRMYTEDTANQRSFVEATIDAVQIRRVRSSGIISCSVDVGDGTADLYAVSSDNYYRGRVTASQAGVAIESGYGNRISVNSSTINLQGSVNGTDSGSFDTLRTRNPPSSSGSASVRMGTDSSNRGILYETTSSRRFKKDIQDWMPDREAVLALQPRTWRQKDQEGEPPDPRWYVGFVAEEVDELGLTHLVDYEDAEDGTPIPRALQYDRFAAAQQIVLQDHEARINELETELAYLKEQLTA